MSRFYLLLIASLFLVVSFTHAQDYPPLVQWQKRVGGSDYDNATRILQTTDGGYVLIGWSPSSDGDKTCYKGAMDFWLVKFSNSGSVVWSKCYGGLADEERPDIINTTDGGFLIAGSTRSIESPVDTFDVVGNHGGWNTYDGWLVKIKSNGDIEWKKCYGGSGADIVRSIVSTTDGGYIMIGETNSIDGDLAGVNSINTFFKVWVVKLTNAGSIQWQKCYGGGGSGQSAAKIIQTQDGGYAFIGNINHGFGDIITQWHGGVDIWLVKTDNGGSSIWQRALGGSQEDMGRDIKQTADGQFIIAGSTKSSDGDIATPLVGFKKGWVLKLNGGGSVVWQHPYGGNQTDDFTKILLSGNNIYLAGYTHSTDLPGANLSGNQSLGDGYLVKLNDAGNMIWQQCYGSYGGDNFMDIVQSEDGEFAIGGSSSKYSTSTSGVYGPSDYWIVKTGSYNTIKGSVFYDYNGNGIKDNNDKDANIIVKSTKPGFSWGSNINNGAFGHRVDTGTITTAPLITLPYYTVIPASKQTVFNTYYNVDSVVFALQPIPGKRDYGVNLFFNTPARPGFNVTYSLRCVNVGTDTLVNKTVKLIKDSRLDFISATPAQTGITADTISWNIAQLLPGETMLIDITTKLLVQSHMGILFLTAGIDSAGDVATSNNQAGIAHIITGSYDPNDKREVHGDTLYKHQYDAGDYLTYTIRFQNTGTDTAFNIAVKDTLSDKLDYNSLEMIGASHPLKLLIKDGKYCTWTFNNILLPDSNRNEPASHGFITYRIKPENGLTINDAIFNSASIYFDFNLPVKTNTQETVLKLTPPTQPVVNGLQAAYCSSLPTTQTGKINNLPLATSGITVSVKLDATPLTIAADSTFSFAVNGLTAGPHAIEVLFSNSSGNKTATHNFTVTAAVTPDVNATANITNVTNLSLPVIVTAVNTTGGGAAPLYTFAKDRNFTNVLQAEGTGSTLNIDASTLTVGDNWIHVRMKSNATCITTQTNSDSINIRRDQSTGIVDPDDPNAVINIYPNPFKEQVVINGLNTQKKYVITITNIQGQQLYTRRIANRASMEIPPLKGPGGIYWLTIYDESRKRSIGSVKLIKQ
jgi:uncharacterized repeat protein (TIGR01451 family)